MTADSESGVQPAARAAPGKLAILYDGSCAMCRAALQGVREFDNSGDIVAFDLHDEEMRTRFPGLSRDDLLEELHALDDRGRVYRGARAINEILRRQKGIRGYLAYLWYIPGYAYVAELQYKRIAASRFERDAHGRLRSPGAKAP